MGRRALAGLSSFLCVALAALFAAAQGVSPSLTRIGAAAAVQGSIKATAPGQVGRIISSGKPLFLNDRVVSDSSGKMQVLLLDQTVFTLGPNADMVLDEFVYDPHTNAGKLTARIVKGAFRFITGRIARRNPDSMRVKLAVGTIGVRGTVVMGETGPGGSTVINAGAGSGNNADEPASALFVENEGQTVDVDQTGQGTTIKPGQPPAPPSDMGQQMDKLLDGLETETKKPSGKGGGEQAGSDAGQDTAKGKDFVAFTEGTDEDAAKLEKGLANAVQDAADNSLLNSVVPVVVVDANWLDVQSIPSGTGSYVASGAFAQTVTNSLATNHVGTWSYNLSVNFGTQLATVNATINTSAAGGNINQSFTGMTHPYGSDTGLATFATTTSFGTFNFKFQNVDSTPAGQVEGTASYNFAGSNVGASVGAVVAPQQ